MKQKGTCLLLLAGCFPLPRDTLFYPVANGESAERRCLLGLAIHFKPKTFEAHKPLNRPLPAVAQAAKDAKLRKENTKRV
jgi:hypothetical protein